MTSETVTMINDLVKDLSLAGFAIVALAVLYRDTKAERTMWLGLFSKILTDQMKMIEAQAHLIEDLKVMYEDNDVFTTSARVQPIQFDRDQDKDRAA